MYFSDGNLQLGTNISKREGLSLADATSGYFMHDPKQFLQNTNIFCFLNSLKSHDVCITSNEYEGSNLNFLHCI